MWTEKWREVGGGNIWDVASLTNVANQISGDKAQTRFGVRGGTPLWLADALNTAFAQQGLPATASVEPASGYGFSGLDDYIVVSYDTGMPAVYVGGPPGAQAKTYGAWPTLAVAIALAIVAVAAAVVLIFVWKTTERVFEWVESLPAPVQGMLAGAAALGIIALSVVYLSSKVQAKK